MKYFVILDLTDVGDGVSANEFDSVEEAYAFYDEFDCPRWVAVEVLRPTPRAVDGGQAGDQIGQVALPTATNAKR